MCRSSVMRLLPAIFRRSGRFPWHAYPLCSGSFTDKMAFSAAAGSESAPYVDLKSFGQSDSSASASSWKEEERSRASSTPKLKWREEEERVLQASLRHVIALGWSDAAMIAGAREVGVSPSIVGSFPRKEAALVEFFMDDCLQKLIDIVDTMEDLKILIPSQRVAKLVRVRLEMQAPFISKWPQALSIQALPSNIPSSFKQRAMLVDEICHAAGDESAAIDWYVKRTVTGVVYSTAEVYMLTDTSPGFKETWAFLDDRVRDAFDMTKSFQEAKYLAVAVGEGVGRSLQGLVRGVPGAKL